MKWFATFWKRQSPTHTNRNMDLQRQELIVHARQATGRHSRAYVYFKYTCKHCKTRLCFSRPNVLYAYGDCIKCDRRTKVEAGGYYLIFAINPKAYCPTYGIEENQGACSTSETPPEVRE